MLILICMVGALIWFYSEYVLFILAAAYMLTGIFTRFAWIIRKRPAPPAYEEAHQSQ
jgi:uncharacterized membrane protein